MQRCAVKRKTIIFVIVFFNLFLPSQFTIHKPKEEQCNAMRTFIITGIVIAIAEQTLILALAFCALVRVVRYSADIS